MKSFLYRILCGFCLGISIFAPGISGSIMAIIMGIYDKLLSILANPFKEFKKNVIFLLPVGIGAAISLVFFVLFFSYLFETYATATYLLFIGLIAGNLPLVFKEANKEKFKPHFLLGIVVAIAIAFSMSVLSSENVIGLQNSLFTSNNLIYLAICGALAGASSLIPGMSISMILIIMGVYDKLMLAAKNLDILIIMIVGIAFVAAMIASSRLIKFIFAKFNSFANFMVFGFLCGSIAGFLYILPVWNNSFNWFTGILMLLIGLAISLLFVFLGKKVEVESV